MITALYDASAAGVPIDLVVRGISCLRPGVPGLSDTIRVRSIVGEFLEHSRVYRFGADPIDAEYLIGSADLMPRNLDRRVEAIVPVDDPKLRARLAEMLELNLADDELAWSLGPDGAWTKITGDASVSTQRRLREIAVSRARATT
jgi:polyphosphate kinase